MKPLNEATVLLTGASGGIGRACAAAFVHAGAKVMMSDVDESARGLQSATAHFHPADLRDERAVRELIDATVKHFGALDALVNNAAIFAPMAPAHDTTAEQFDLLFQINVRGALLCCKHAYPHLKRNGGAIVTVSSMAGMEGEKGHAAYAASKGALNALTKAMAIDYGPDGIRCNAVCPSSVLTPNTDRLIDNAPDPRAIIELRKKINLLGYTATPAEIASVVVFLASPGASFITGAIVPVSGGSECGYGIKP